MPHITRWHLFVVEENGEVYLKIKLPGAEYPFDAAQGS